MKNILIITIFAIFWLSVILVEAAEKTPSENDLFTEYEQWNDCVVMIAIYKTEYYPPKFLNKNKKAHGGCYHYARIVKVYKGVAKVGEKIIFQRGIEDWPKWLTEDFTVYVDSELHYMFLNKKEAIMKNKSFYLGDKPFSFSITDELFAELFMTKYEDKTK